MSLYLRIILYICINTLSLYTLNNAIGIFLESKQNINPIKKNISYAIYFLIGTFTYFHSEASLKNVIVQVVLVYIITFNFLGSIVNKFILVCSWASITMLMEMIVGIFYVLLFNESLDLIVDDEISRLIATIIYTLVILIIVKTVSLYKNKISEKQSLMDSLYVGIIPLFSILLLYFFTEMSLAYQISHYIIIASCILIVFINVFFFVFFDKLRMAEKLKYEHELLKNQSEYYLRLEENINDTFEKVRIIKHDLKYQLLYLKAKTEENTKQSLEDIGTALDSLISDTLSEEFVQYTKNKKLNRLLNYKLFSLSQSNIDLDIKVTIRQDTHIDESSLYSILGNAIDNAVRNFDNSKSDVKKIVIRIVDDCDNLYIKIANPYAKKLHFKNGLPITDKENKELHGVGLRSIKSFVESKNGYLKITAADYIFTLEILLYDELKLKNSHQT